MPQDNLSALNGQELRQLLDSSRRRGDAALSYKVLQEMAARRDAPAERRAGRRAPEPRNIDVHVSEPAEADDIPPMPNWPPRAFVAVADEAEPEAPPMPPEHDRPLTLHDPEAEPFDDEAPLRMGAARRPFQPIELGAPAKPKSSRLPLFGAAALAVTLGLAIGWLGGWLARDAMAPPAAAAAPIQTAALTPPPAPPPVAQSPEPAPETSPDPATAQAAPDLGPAPAPPSKAPEAAPAAAPASDGAALELPAPDAEPPKVATKKIPLTPPAATTATSAACAKAPTPADRAICGDPKLKRLQADLRRAYDEALGAHEDRALLREHQLAWRDARGPVADPERLARLYEERIRKLNAATAEARRAQAR